MTLTPSSIRSSLSFFLFLSLLCRFVSLFPFPSPPLSPFPLWFTFPSRLVSVLFCLCVSIHVIGRVKTACTYSLQTQHALCPTVKYENACCVKKLIAKTSAERAQRLTVPFVYTHSYFVCAGNILLDSPQVEAEVHGWSLQQHLHLSLHWCCSHLLPSRLSTHVSALPSHTLLMRCLRQVLVCTHSSTHMCLKSAWTHFAAGVCSEFPSFMLAYDADIHSFLHTQVPGKRMAVVCQRCLWGVPELHVYLRFRYALSPAYASA